MLRPIFAEAIFALKSYHINDDDNHFFHSSPSCMNIIHSEHAIDWSGHKMASTLNLFYYSAWELLNRLNLKFKGQFVYWKKLILETFKIISNGTAVVKICENAVVKTAWACGFSKYGIMNDKW